MRDLVVIGASAGGVHALSRVAADLPADLDAAVVAVLHVPANGTSVLPIVLSRAGALPAEHARHGRRLQRGHIYVAPPDRHVLVHDGVVQLSRGPRENRHRPAVDPLFRSAARARGPRVVGVILSGTLDDGTLGLDRIRARGGLAIVQDPADAEYPGMPANALRVVGADLVLPLEEIGAAIARAVGQTAPAWASDPPERPSRVDTQRPCLTCKGGLGEVQEHELVRFPCGVEHAYAPGALAGDEDHALEGALWAAARSLRESAAIDRRLEELARAGRAPGRSAVHEENARAKEGQAARIEALLLMRGGQAKPWRDA
ncbi:MAG TPA: chemotaxis protein CheB [Minicystis sp.]|nr:chemotaxis protein CheB [Minicystis sp.]